MFLLHLALRTLPLQEVSATPINNDFLLSTTIYNAFNSTNNFEAASSCPGEQRTVLEITWSCLVTIFACTWLAIHPNLPPDNKWWTTVRRRVILWIYALIAPETIVFWAMRQWYAAGAYTEKYKAQGWTRTHGFFLQMGGFVIYDDLAETKGAPRTVSPPEFNELMEKKLIVFPTITGDEIQDRSKGDLLAKGIVVVQTLWFILQCIARKRQGLLITELEVVTLALAALNAVMYFLWWHKPLDIKCPVTLVAVSLCSDDDAPHTGTLLVVDSSPPIPMNVPHPPVSLVRRIRNWFADKCTLSNVLKFMKQALSVLALLPISLIALFLLALFPLNAMTGNVDNSLSSRYAQFPSTDTPLFYAPRISRKKTMFAFAFVVAAGFGAIHCVAWNFTFVTPVEKLLWRISSMSITVLPLAYLCLGALEWASEAGLFRIGVLTNLIRQLKSLQRWPTSQFACLLLSSIRIPKIIIDAWNYIEGMTIVLGFAAGVALYILARLYMIVEAFLSLRDLPQAVLQEVEWTKYIPHI